jgi:predicted Zn-dependent protease
VTRTILLAIALLAAACTVPPAWEPGDPPLTFSVDSDRTAELVLMGCAPWAEAVGLECAIAARGDGASVVVDAYQAELDHYGDGVRGYSRTRPCGFLWTDRSYMMVLDVATYALMDGDLHDPENAEAMLDKAAAISAHEIGHLLGIWDHVEGPALMDIQVSAYYVTPRDLDALPWAVP